MENKLVLADETKVVNGFASKSSRNQLMVHVPGNNLVKVATVFGNPEKTKTIICYHSIYKTTYKGFTDMYTIQYFESEDYVELWLRPVEGVETSIEREVIVPKEYVPEEVTDNAR